MAYDEHLAERIHRVLGSRKGLEAKKMFGGICFLLQGKMVAGVVRNDLMVRVVPAKYQETLAKPHCRPMDFTGKPLKNFLYVAPEGVDSEHDLESWLALGIEFIEQEPAKSKRDRSTC